MNVKEYNDMNKYTAKKNLLKDTDTTKNNYNSKVIGFLLKNHDNKHLFARLKENPINVSYPKTQQKKEYEKVHTFFEGLQDLGVKFTVTDSNKKDLSELETVVDNSNHIEEQIQEKSSRPKDDPFMKFLYGLSDYMKSNDQKIYIPAQKVVQRILESKYSYQTEIISKGYLGKYLDKYVNELYKKTRDKKVFDYKNEMYSKCDKKYKEGYLQFLPQIEYYDCVEFKNCLYFIREHRYWSKKDIDSNLDPSDEQIQSKLKELKEKFACLKYFDEIFDKDAVPIAFVQILDNSLSEEDKYKFILAYSKLWQHKEIREEGIHLYGETKSGKTTLFRPLIKLFGGDRIGMIDPYAGGFEMTLLTEDLKVNIFDEFDAKPNLRSKLLRILSGEEQPNNGKYAGIVRYQCDVHTVILSNKKMSFGKKEGDYDPDKAIDGRIETFLFKPLVNPEQKYIENIEKEIPGILMLCNDTHFGFKAKKDHVYPIDNHPEINSILDQRKREEMKKRKREELDEEEWKSDKEIIPVLKKQRIQ